VRSTKHFELFIPYEAAFDVQTELSRLRKELDRLTKDIASKQSRLADETFRSRAPENIVKGLESTLAERRTEFNKLGERLAQLERL
jgi:valyl-tRNA synthetase